MANIEKINLVHTKIVAKNNFICDMLHNKKSKNKVGRPKSKYDLKLYSFKLPILIMAKIKGNKTQFVIEAIKAHLAAKY